MDMSLDQSATPNRSFWRTWRREIVRGGVLFTLVVGTGLFIRSVRIHVPSPLGALGSFGDFNWGDGEGAISSVAAAKSAIRGNTGSSSNRRSTSGSATRTVRSTSSRERATAS